MKLIKSVNGVPIRLTDKRWLHIIENHNDVAGYYDDILNAVENPDFVIKGYRDDVMAVLRRKAKYLVVVYKELSKKDGFIITAYFTSKLDLNKEEILWQKQS